MQKYHVTSPIETFKLGQEIATSLKGGEVIEMIGDVGAGKTTLVKGIAQGLGVKEAVQSPSFTIFAHYEAGGGKQLHHYDFYRLQDPGLVGYDLAESLQTEGAVTIIEWAGNVENVLPGRRRVIRIVPISDEARTIEIEEYR